MDRNDTGLGPHQLVLIHGRERAREMVPERQRPLVDIAAEVMADGPADLALVAAPTPTLLGLLLALTG